MALQSSLYGDWGKCIDGRKFYCCEAEAQVPDCRWTGCGGSCSSDENEMTWRYGDCPFGGEEKFCCSKEEEWKNCGWRGEEGSCFDNHCETGWQVSLTTSYEGEGDSCGIKLERERSFCCDPPDGQSPFLPVPLEYLFEDPPPEEEADTDFTLKTDNTWGGAVDAPFTEDPDNAAFGFVVLTSPDELQVSLDKRDGSHWEVFDCHDAVTEGEHTVRMMCTNLSEGSNCGKIHLGHGAPGTIVEMPKGCGPGRYAVVKDLVASTNQSLPHHLARRGLENIDTVYDLTFDYQFRRVPRDLGNTQMRIDVSNQPEYWDNVVNKAADHRKVRKRSLVDAGGSHRRWLEEEWRDDLHFGALSKEELHKRWFGSDIIDWLRGLVNGVSGGLSVSHTYSEDFVLKIIDQRLQCPNFAARLDVHAETHVDIDVDYGFTLIATLGGDNGLIDLSRSYLYFRSKGEVVAKFVVDAAFTAMFDTGDVLMFSADKFGVTFSVPGIVTVGPNFKLFGRLDGEATLGVNFESRVKLAEWDVRQTYPAENDDWDPEATRPPQKSGTQNVLEPEFGYGVALSGHLSAHVKPTITFGIDFNSDFIPIDSCAVNLVADGHVTFHARAQSSDMSFCYGIDAGADLYATIDAPSAFSWALPRSPFPIVPIDDVQIYPTSGGEACINLAAKRGLDGLLPEGRPSPRADNATGRDYRLGKRAIAYGPLVPRISGLQCPGAVDIEGIPSCPLCADDGPSDRLGKRAESCYFSPDATEPACPSDMPEKRDILHPLLDAAAPSNGSLHVLAKRDTKYVRWNGYDLQVGTYERCGNAPNAYQRWYGYPREQNDAACQLAIQKLNRPQIDPRRFATEHVYEAQLLARFLDWLTGTGREANLPFPSGYTRATGAWVDAVLVGDSPGQVPVVHPNWGQTSAFFQMASGLGSDRNPRGLVLADRDMNGKKGKFFGGDVIDPRVSISNRNTRLEHRNVSSHPFHSPSTLHRTRACAKI